MHKPYTNVLSSISERRYSSRFYTVVRDIEMKNDDFSINLSSIFIKLIGIWMANGQSEKYVRNMTIVYSIIALVFGLWLQITDMYYSWGDFSECIFSMCNMLSIAAPLLKLITLIVHRKDFFYLILYLQRKFLHGDYDDYERNIVLNCKRKCTFFTCSLTFTTLATVVSYIINPLIANIGRNESDRVLPFNIWIDLPLTITPYYEITFVLEVISLYHIGVSYFCFDNFLCIMNLHVAGQFQVLQHRISNITDLVIRKEEKKEKLIVDSSYFASKCYAIFKKCIRQHQALIAYCRKLEEVFNLIVLEQVLMFSMLICLDGYLVLMADTSTTTRLIFGLHITVCLCQLLMFTYSCDCIIRESLSVATAANRGPWPMVPMTTTGRMMKKDLILVIMRSGIPCCLTGKGFFVVSLETYTSVLSTAASYFTLLKQHSEAHS
ncbi:odorant receptor Or2-like [Apis laboriosa]|uniref:odorant receptor Or2-like n=1 Tax=Apis laboriosa TaxID=183418 RepID=UPI001CC40AEC|nr:odorant receptor Or2-like [Apis laboriosa]